MDKKTQEKSLEKKIAEDLHRTGSIKFGEFKLSSGRESPYYIDLKNTISYPQAFGRIVSALDLELGEETEKITAVPTGSLPFAGALLERRLLTRGKNLSMAYVRKGERTKGTKEMIEGELKKKELLAVIDDVSSTGASLIDAIYKIKDGGGRVQEAITIVDRNEGAVGNLRKEGVRLNYVTDTLHIIGHLKVEGMISEEEYLSVINYIEEQN